MQKTFEINLLNVMWTHISPCDAVINELKEDGTLEKFVQNLADHEQTDKFIKTVKSLAQRNNAFH